MGQKNGAAVNTGNAGFKTGQMIKPSLKTMALKYHNEPVAGKFAIKPLKAMNN